MSTLVYAQTSVDVRFNFKRGSYKGSYYDVVVTKNGKEHNLTWFKPWEEVLMVEMSPDSNYAFVRHKPQGGKAYRLSLYNLKTLKLIRSIVPGTGGDFEWNNLNQIIHTWGCGTNCAPLVVYDLKLNTIFKTLSSGGFLMSPDKRYAVQFSMHEDEMWVYDLKSLKTGKYPLTYYTPVDSAYKLWYADETMNVKFSDPTSIRLISKNRERELYIPLTRVNEWWKRVNPDTTGEYYLR